ncbi:hypothetical protein [Nonomuraea endophytica]|uniref:hypothetical protein n=1 Tax=Nonomuraea endophytica TaxID=714136 RepID=UPI0037C80377
MSLQQRLVGRLPAWVRTQPIDAMFALFGLPSGLTLLAGQARSRALETVLPLWANYLWGVCLVLGCAAYLIGLTSGRFRDGRLVITRIAALVFALQVLSPAALVYGLTILLVSGWGGLLAAWFPLVAAAATWIRRVELQREQA